MLDELDTIIRSSAVSTLFQPIINLNRRKIFGYEALSRGPSDSQLHSPITLFELAARSGRLFELELLCRELAMRQFQRLELAGNLFLNATPLSLLQPDHRSGKTLEKLREIGLDPQRVVIELTEQQPLDDYDLMRQATEHYRAMGFRIAIDDLGAGYAGLRMWAELRPDYVKIDRHFIQGIDEDRVKQEFVRSIIDISQGLNCEIIAEGIETEAEYRTVFAMGIEMGQGYYFARPRAAPPTVMRAELFTSDSARSTHSHLMRLSETVAVLAHDITHVAPETTTERVFEIFSGAPDLHSIPVVDQLRQPLGMVRRHRLMDVCAANYGRALYGKKPVVRFMDPGTVIVDRDMSLEQVSQLVTDTAYRHPVNDFVITCSGKYMGIGKVMDLLKKITELQIRNARYANPLTLLPGNVPIYEELDRLLEEGRRFAVAYCDLDSFKPFNDVYGYARGDQVIQTVAEILTTHVDCRNDFAGHVGGDDFILIFTSENWRERCNAILEQFEREIPNVYTQTDREQGGILAQDRSGSTAFYPLLSLSIGVVTPEPGSCESHHDVAALATEAKHQAKRLNGNALFVDRRTKPDGCGEPNPRQ